MPAIPHKIEVRKALSGYGYEVYVDGAEVRWYEPNAGTGLEDAQECAMRLYLQSQRPCEVWYFGKRVIPKE